MNDQLLNTIKQRGYWRINFQPIVMKERLEKSSDCKDVVIKNSVRLRGWDFPHVSHKNDDKSGMGFTGKYYEGWDEWSHYKEFWRIYKSGQFLCYRALREDWLDQSHWGSESSKQITPMNYLGVIGTVIYELTEMLEFLFRLTKDGLYEEGVIINISLHNLKGRTLWIEDGNRMPFMFPRKTGAEIFTFEKEYSKEEVVSGSKEIANKIILELFDLFEWTPTADQIRNDQDKLLSGRA